VAGTDTNLSIAQLAVALYVPLVGSHTRLHELMTGSTSGYDDRTTRQRLATATQYEQDTFAFESTVVRYEDGPDRCTIAPRECSETERLTKWLSVDLEAVVDLDELR